MEPQREISIDMAEDEWAAMMNELNVEVHRCMKKTERAQESGRHLTVSEQVTLA